MVNIVLADNNQAIRKGLRALLASEPDFTIVGEAENGLEALEIVRSTLPDIIILDLIMPRLSGLEVARCLCRDYPETRIMMLSIYGNEAYVSEALHSGAKAYILKESPPELLLQAIRIVMSNNLYLSPPLSETIIQNYVSKTENNISK